MLNGKYDIIIEGGQSNADGSGIGPVENEHIPSSQILYLDAIKSVDLDETGLHIEYADLPFEIKEAEELVVDGNKRGNLALSFANDYIASGLLSADRKILIIKAAIGGTGFYKGHWGLQDKVYLKMLEMVDYALQLNPKNKIVAFLWHQGEHDAYEGNPPDIYHKQLSDMLQGVRNRFGTMPFIAADFVHDWKNKNLQACKPIVQVIRNVVNENKKSAFVETDGLLSNDQKIGNKDELHFCRESLYELGHRYFKAFSQLIGD